MPRLIWSPPAILNVARLQQFLAEKNPEAARQALKAIRAGVKVLAQQPAIGRPAEDMEPEFREWLIAFGESGYVVQYRYDTPTETAVITAVRHQREVGY